MARSAGPIAALVIVVGACAIALGALLFGGVFSASRGKSRLAEGGQGGAFSVARAGRSGRSPLARRAFDPDDELDPDEADPDEADPDEADPGARLGGDRSAGARRLGREAGGRAAVGGDGRRALSRTGRLTGTGTLGRRGGMTGGSGRRAGGRSGGGRAAQGRRSGTSAAGSAGGLGETADDEAPERPGVGSIAGRVIDPEGAPVAGARVTWAGVLERVTTSEADGGFLLDNIPTGVSSVVAAQLGDGPIGMSEPIALEAAGVTQGGVVVVLDGVTGTIIGRTVDTEGAPVPGIEVSVRVNQGTIAGDRSGADGAFRFEGIPAGPATVLGRRENGDRQHIGMRVLPDQEVNVELVFSGGQEIIAGRIVDGEGKGVRWVTLTLQPQAGKTRVSSSREGGVFDFKGLESGSYRLTARKGGFPETRVDVESGQQDLEIVLDSSGNGTIRGVLVGPGLPAGSLDRRPIIKAQISGSGQRVYKVPRLLADGVTFEIPTPPGTYDVAASTAEGLVGVTRGIQVTAGETADIGSLPVSRDVVIRGRFVDASGEGLPGVTVRSVFGQYSLGPEVYRDGPFAGAITDESGFFEATGVPGQPTLRAYRPGYRGWAWQGNDQAGELDLGEITLNGSSPTPSEE